MSVSPKMHKVKGSQTLLYYKFIASKQHRTDTIAEKMGVSSDTLYRYVRGERQLPIDRIPDLVNATGDIEFPDYLADRCGFNLIPKIKDKHALKTLSHLLNIVHSAINGKDDGK